MVALALAVFALGPDGGVARELQAGGEKRGADLVELFVAPALAVGVDRRRADRDPIAEGPVDVEGRAGVVPRAEGLGDLGKIAVEAGLLRGDGGDAAETAVAEEDGVGPATEVEALDDVAVVR